MLNDEKSIINFIFEAAKITESAAIAAFDWVGLGDEKSADQAAVNSIRNSLNNLNIDGEIVIGEGERDKAPMLYIGEKVGKGGIKLDIALDPLEGTTICAHAEAGAMSVMAIGAEGSFLNAPDLYMQKIAVGPDVPRELISLDNTPETNINNLAKIKKCRKQDITAIILNRPRHTDLIADIRAAGAKVQLINDGDIAAVINAALSSKDNPYIYMGIGGAPEGVLAAAALQALGGFIIGKLIFYDDKEKERARKLGIMDFHKIYELEDLAKTDVIFAASGVTDGTILKGVKKVQGQVMVNSIVSYAKMKQIHKIESKYILNKS